MDDDRYRLDDFELYQAARAFRNKVYRLLKALPPEEKYCLATQMRRAAISISNNIAEGHGRWKYPDNSRFCRIARGSLSEVIDDLNICLDQHYDNPEAVMALKDEGYTLIRRINGYIAYLSRTQSRNDKS